MKIPKKFTLGAVTWKVRESSPLPGLYGNCDAANSTINLEKKLKGDVKGQTFCHELTHAIMTSMGKKDHDEEFVDGFATYLHQFLNGYK